MKRILAIGALCVAAPIIGWFIGGLTVFIVMLAKLGSLEASERFADADWDEWEWEQLL